MIYVICSSCGTRYPRGSKCPNHCYEKYLRDKSCVELKKQADRKYDKENRKNIDFYHSVDWQNIRLLCQNKYNNMCVYSFIKYKKIVRSHLVHHIIEVNEDRNKALDINNLIPVCHSAHNEIHMRYKIDKKKAQQELYEIIKKWEEIYNRG